MSKVTDPELLKRIQDIHDAMKLTARGCPPLLQCLNKGVGGLHMTDLHVRNDGVEYDMSADWVDDVARLLHDLLKD